MSDIRRKPSSFEEYWLESKAWERKGLPLGTARALARAASAAAEIEYQHTPQQDEILPKFSS